MSYFIGNAMPRFHLERRNDNYAPFDPRRRDQPRRRRPQRGAPGFGHMQVHWPLNTPSLLGDYGTDVGVFDSRWSPRYYRIGLGAGSRVGFVGVTRDQYGAPLGSCVVQLFRTADDLFIMEVTSDSNGNFLLQSWYTPDTHYIVAYKAGSTDVFGTTLNTLVGV